MTTETMTPRAELARHLEWYSRQAELDPAAPVDSALAGQRLPAWARSPVPTITAALDAVSPDARAGIAKLADGIVLQPAWPIRPGILTRFRGKPMMPEGTEWPRDAAGRPLHLLMQVNLAEMPLALVEKLPRQGILCIFAPLGLDLPDRILTPLTIVTRFFPDPSACTEAEPPDDLELCALKPLVPMDEDDPRCPPAVPLIGVRRPIASDGRSGAGLFDGLDRLDPLSRSVAIAARAFDAALDAFLPPPGSRPARPGDTWLTRPPMQIDLRAACRVWDEDGQTPLTEAMLARAFEAATAPLDEAGIAALAKAGEADPARSLREARRLGTIALLERGDPGAQIFNPHEMAGLFGPAEIIGRHQLLGTPVRLGQRRAGPTGTEHIC